MASLGILFGSSLSSSHGSLLCLHNFVIYCSLNLLSFYPCLSRFHSLSIYTLSPSSLRPLTYQLPAWAYCPARSWALRSLFLYPIFQFIFLSSSSSSSFMTLFLPMSWMVPAQSGLAHSGGTMLDPKWSIDFATSNCLACASSCCQQLRCPGVAMRWSLRCRLWCQCRLCCSLQLSAICILAFSPPISSNLAISFHVLPGPPVASLGILSGSSLSLLSFSLSFSHMGEKKLGSRPGILSCSLSCLLLLLPLLYPWYYLSPLLSLFVYAISLITHDSHIVHIWILEL